MAWNNLTQPLSNEQQSQILIQAVEWIQLQHFSLSILRDPIQLSYRASMAVHAVTTCLGLNLPGEMQTSLVQPLGLGGHPQRGCQAAARPGDGRGAH